VPFSKVTGSSNWCLYATRQDSIGDWCKKCSTRSYIGPVAIEGV
jgi:hypothetical protein